MATSDGSLGIRYIQDGKGIVHVVPHQRSYPDAAVQAAPPKLKNNPSLADRTTLTPAQIADLLTFVLRSTYFQYNGSIYEQKDGAAMGSPVSAVIANLYMESSKNRR